MTLPSNKLRELLAAFAALPRNWRKAYIQRVVERSDQRIEVIKARLSGITSGATMPEPDDVAIGSGRRFRIAVLFLDVCGFTQIPSSNFTEQSSVLVLLQVFMAEMMSIIKDHNGTFEKNTGDGLMAYFGTETQSDSESVRSAVEAALLMHYVTDTLINPWLLREQLPVVRFRIGIDFGDVTVARIGVPGTNTFVAIGCTANIANRIMELIPDGGIAAGDRVHSLMPLLWRSSATALPPAPGYVYLATGTPYPAWRINYRLVGQPY